MSLDWSKAFERFERAKRYGFRFRHDSEMHRPYRPKPGSHDDGLFNGPFLGGIGTASFSRDLHGQFSRWHLQQGVHSHQVIDSCFLFVSWSEGGQRFSRRLEIGEGDTRFRASEREYATLFPVCYEHYKGDFPFELLLEYYSPTIPGDDKASSLPVTLFNLYVRSTGSKTADLTAAFFWPNMLGWRQFSQSSELREGQLWPAFTNAGNFCEVAEVDLPKTLAVAQRRHEPVRTTRDMTGETFLCVQADGQLGREICFMADQATTGAPHHEQRFTVAYVEHRLAETGDLPSEGISWTAHWHEPLGSAVSSRFNIPAGTEAHATFVLVNDLPLTEFGSQRCWEKEYTRFYGTEGRAGDRITADALQLNSSWLRAIDDWHVKALLTFSERGIAKEIGGCAINELSFVIGGGSTWVAQQHPNTREDHPTLSASGHFGLLEGFDNGYYFFNTSDLWIYAFSSLSLNWPSLADGVFHDYLECIELVDDRRRPTYRAFEVAPLLADGKIPHDVGGVAEDPWVDLNGYALRDDPNLWKDHNPSFIVSYLLHAHLRNKLISQAEYRALRRAADFIIAQDEKGFGIPEHRDFGDSTWDNLEMRGLSTYAGAFCLAAWAGMERVARGLGHDEDSRLFADLKVKASNSLNTLWSGEYYLTNNEGKYGRAVMADALFGLFYASLMGLPDLVEHDRICRHLKAVYRYSFQNYAGGCVGPLLVSEPNRLHYEQDGGQELQVNEVLVGAAWMYVAMAYHYGLKSEADHVASVLRGMIYDGTGLQFRTPAAWNKDGQYRAPLNMRPLAVWLLAIKS